MTDLPKHRLEDLKSQINKISGHDPETPIYNELRAKLDAENTMDTLFPGLLSKVKEATK